MLAIKSFYPKLNGRTIKLNCQFIKILSANGKANFKITTINMLNQSELCLIDLDMNKSQFQLLKLPNFNIFVNLVLKQNKLNYNNLIKSSLKNIKFYNL